MRSFAIGVSYARLVHYLYVTHISDSPFSLFHFLSFFFYLHLASLKVQKPRGKGKKIILLSFP